MQVQPYLFFNGRCEEALQFYESAVGAKIGALMRFKDSPDKTGINPAAENKVMHASFEIGDTMVLASDGPNSGQPKFEGFALAINASDEAEADRFFNGLVDGGQVTQPLTKTFFSPRFGMLADKFGVHWIVIAAQ